MTTTTQHASRNQSLITMPEGMPEKTGELLSLTVTLDTPKGEAKLDVRAWEPETGAKRAFMTAVHAGWGDLDDITVTDVSLMEGVW